MNTKISKLEDGIRILSDKIEGLKQEEKTFENLKKNPKVTVAVVDPAAVAYQFKGSAAIFTEGPLYRQAEEESKKRGQPPPVAMVTVKVEEIYSLTPGGDAGERIG